MSAISEKIAYANETKALIAQAIVNKGGTVADTDAFRDYATRIADLPTGGYTGHVDAVGLAEIGWNEADIAYYQERVWWNEEDDALWAVSDAEKTDYALLLAQSAPLLADVWRWLPKIDHTAISGDAAVLPIGVGELAPYVIGFPQTWNGDTQITTLMVSSRASFVPVFEHLALETLYVVDCSYLESLSGFDTSNCFAIVIAENPMLRSITGMDASLAIAPDEGDGGWVLGACPSLMRCEIANLGENIDLSDSLFLSHDSMVYMMENAQTVTDKAMTFGAYNLSKLTDDEIAVATGKGWTVA